MPIDVSVPGFWWRAPIGRGGEVAKICLPSGSRRFNPIDRRLRCPQATEGDSAAPRLDWRGPSGRRRSPTFDDIGAVVGELAAEFGAEHDHAVEDPQARRTGAPPRPAREHPTWDSYQMPSQVVSRQSIPESEQPQSARRAHPRRGAR